MFVCVHDRSEDRDRQSDAGEKWSSRRVEESALKLTLSREAC